MPKFDEKRCVVNGVLLSVPEYLRLLAADVQYAAQRNELLSWADQWEKENGGQNEAF